MEKEFSKLCSPAKLYLVITVIGIVLSLFNNISVAAVIVKVIFALFWTFVLNWLCEKGYKTLSWILVLLPFIVIILGMFEIYKFAKR